MKKLLLIMLASLFMLTSCEDILAILEEEESIEYATLTQEKADEISNIMSQVEIDVDSSLIDFYTAISTAGNNYIDTDEAQYISEIGDNYSYSVTCTDFIDSEGEYTETEIYDDKISNDNSFIYNGSLVIAETIDKYFEVTGDVDNYLYTVSIIFDTPFLFCQ